MESRRATKFQRYGRWFYAPKNQLSTTGHVRDVSEPGNKKLKWMYCYFGRTISFANEFIKIYSVSTSIFGFLNLVYPALSAIAPTSK